MPAKADDPAGTEKTRVANSGARLAPELAWAAVLHVWNDGLPVALTVLLPSITAELRLTYMQAALLRTLDTGAAGAAQIPLAALASRGLEIPLMGGGLVWFGVFTAALGLAMAFLTALGFATVGGIGGGAYHPIATNRVARLAPQSAVGRMVGTLNFAGDVGKFLFPAAAGVLAGTFGWRISLEVIGGLAALTGGGVPLEPTNGGGDRMELCCASARRSFQSRKLVGDPPAAAVCADDRDDGARLRDPVRHDHVSALSAHGARAWPS